LNIHIYFIATDGVTVYTEVFKKKYTCYFYLMTETPDHVYILVYIY